MKVELAETLFVIPCSKKKRRGTSDGGAQTGSVLDHLTDGLADRLREVRAQNAEPSQLDESVRMAAVERYSGTLYQYAGSAFARLKDAGARLAIVSGGYGLVLGEDRIGWYDRLFVESEWPDRLVSKCLASYAESSNVRTAVGLFGGTTAYAKAFRHVRWDSLVTERWLVTPTAGRAQKKVSRTIGEALALLSKSGELPPNWTSTQGVPVNISAV